MEFLLNIISRTKTEVDAWAICSAAGGCLSFLVGGFDQAAQALMVLIIGDYITGMLAAWKTGTLSSQKGFMGIPRKVAIILVVSLANMLDLGMGLNHLLRGMVICGYAGMEGLSLLENVDRAGYGGYIPVFLRTKLAQLREEKGVAKL
ncbi:phage holin family protein [Anaeromusa sp.]|uniref:phage holin family protein n=1 Tax=Anaeromusa sp. TaxID=1872520 RepID=UPI0026271955|nr:phage holin family protein [Anaeromusa sp.]MDD3157041.1 phage holin family protein [Anaeromusa sp.]